MSGDGQATVDEAGGKVPKGRRRKDRGFNPWTTAPPFPKSRRDAGIPPPALMGLQPRGNACALSGLGVFWGDLDLGLKPQALFLRPLWGLPPAGAWLARDSARFLGAPQISRPDHPQRRPKPPPRSGFVQRC